MQSSDSKVKNGIPFHGELKSSLLILNKINSLNLFMAPHPESKNDATLVTKTKTDHLQLLITALEPYLDFVQQPRGYRFVFSASSQNSCLFLRSGAVSMHRQPDDILFELFEAPSLRGIIPVPRDSISVYTVKTITMAEVAVIEKEKLFALLTEHMLWELFARHILEITSFGAEAMIKISNPSVYGAVRLQLYVLMDRAPEIRSSTLVESYIREKTRFSRSSIMKILSDLRQGGYIVMKNGYLEDITYIPEKY
jgi:CRP-like cAMP-binding protein